MPQNSKKRPTKKRPSIKYRKSNKKTKTFIVVLGILFLVTTLIFCALLFFHKEKVEISYKNEIEYLNTNIRSQLFGLNISNDSLSEYNVIRQNNLVNMQYRIQVSKHKYQSVRNALVDLLKSSGFNVSVNASITAMKSNLNIFIDLEAEKVKPPVIEKETPKEEPTVVEKIGKIAIIIDDAGNNLMLARRVANIPYPITAAILPYTPYDSETYNILKNASKTVLLHLPMEPLSYPKVDPGKGAIMLDTQPDLIGSIIDDDIGQIGKVDGVNNHMGSAVTSNAKKIDQALRSIKKHSLLFIDSHTSNDTVAYDICKKLEMKCGLNRKFLDVQDNKEYIRKMLDESFALVKKYGSIIVIGHLKHNTIEVLEEYMPVLEKKGVLFVSPIEAL